MKIETAIECDAMINAVRFASCAHPQLFTIIKAVIPKDPVACTSRNVFDSS